MAAPAADSPSAIYGFDRTFFEARLLERMLEPDASVPMWALLECADHFLHHDELARAAEYLAKATPRYDTALLDELQAKVTWLSGEQERGLAIARAAEEKWPERRKIFTLMIAAMEAGDSGQLLEEIWHPGPATYEEENELLTSSGLCLRGPELNPDTVTAALGGLAPTHQQHAGQPVAGIRETIVATDGAWRLEQLNKEQHYQDVWELLAPFHARETSLREIAGVTQVDLEIFIATRRPDGSKLGIVAALRPEDQLAAARLGIHVRMIF